MGERGEGGRGEVIRDRRKHRGSFENSEQVVEGELTASLCTYQNNKGVATFHHTQTDRQTHRHTDTHTQTHTHTHTHTHNYTHHHHHHHHQSLNREGRWGTTDDFATSFPPFFPVLHCPLGLAERQACPFPNVVFPPLPLSAFSSSPFHCALQDGFGQT